YQTDELAALVQRAAELAGVDPDADPEQLVSLRVLADHGRASAFLLADGVLPSNVDRGYVLRRVMRRAIRHGVELGIDEPFLHELTDKVIELMSPAYPELAQWREKILRYTRMEEETFRRTLHRGLELLEQTFAQLQSDGEAVVPGQVVFHLHARDGFPPDLTRVIAVERGVAIDEEGYRELMAEHRQVSGGMGTGDQASSGAPGTGAGFGGMATTFGGYQSDAGEGEITAIRSEGARVTAATIGDRVEVVTDSTPFYAESGGQVGDTGTLSWDGGGASVRDTTREGDAVVHHLLVDEGELTVGQRVQLVVGGERRGDIRRNHTATHLLHAALRQALGDHVAQQGSVVDPARLRFDFSHFQAVTADELARVEALANAQVRRDEPVQIEQMTYDDAVARGAIALFGEKYGDEVRVVEVAGFSTELCGGTHCDRTGEIGLIKIVSEGSVGTGVRRIEAQTGRGAEAHVRRLEAERVELAGVLKAQPQEVVGRARRLVERL
ncbi:MAG: alanine--tRNA ligase-related protein, partial [Myxococcota bacterium]|nr:alanine--tRNA ligase-related protein [Myxococcota bacterium]